MFITEKEILAVYGYTVTRPNVNLAQAMLETYTGKMEEDVADGNDKALLAQAVAFQAIYMEERPDGVLKQAAISYSLQGGNATTFDTDMFSPFMSPWAIKACEKLSWNKSRSVHTGKVVQHSPYDRNYAWTHDIGVV